MVDKGKQQQAVENELARERANGLGLTGQALSKAIERYESRLAMTSDDDVRIRTLLAEIVERAQSLLMQRDAHGLVADNLAWLVESYPIPDAAVRELRKSNWRS